MERYTNESEPIHGTMMEKRTDLVMVGVSAESIANLLGGRFLVLGLESRSHGIGGAFEVITEVLSVGLAGVGFEGCCCLVY